MITVGELFAGIAGFSRGLEATGEFQTIWHCEKNEFCQKILSKHYPGVPLHDDVTTFPPDSSPGWAAQMITAGFPCQDLSVAGKGAGLDGKRSGLFFEIIRIARILQPRWLLLENVPALLARGMGKVLSELADSGYDAQWRVLSAAEVGAPHLRKRLFIFCTLADAINESLRRINRGKKQAGRSEERGETTTDSNGTGFTEQRRPLSDETRHIAAKCCSRWAVEAAVGRVANGIPNRVDRLTCLGNAVVPAVIEHLARTWVLPEINAQQQAQPPLVTNGLFVGLSEQKPG